MSEQKHDVTKDVDYNILYRKLYKLNYKCVTAVMLTELATFLMYYLTDNFKTSIPVYILLYIVRPCIINSLALVIGVVMRKSKNEEVSSGAPIVTLMLIMSCMIMVHYTFAATYAGLIIPLFLSVNYGSKEREKKFFLLANVFYTGALLFTLLDKYSSYPTKFPYNVGIGYIAIFFTHILVRALLDFEQGKIAMAQAYCDKLSVVENMANRDGLTGIYNVRMLHEIAEKWAKEKEPLFFVMFDIDDFKKVNDTYGHDMGDVVLKRFAGVMMRYETNDTLAFRYGGEEFGLLIKDTDICQATVVAENIREDFREQRYRNHVGPFTVSGGVAEKKTGMGVEELFKAADERLYEAKKAGKNRVVSPWKSETYIADNASYSVVAPLEK